MHAFLKIPRRVDIPGPLESEAPLIPIVFVIHTFLHNASRRDSLPIFHSYRSPAGPARDNPALNDPKGMSVISLAPSTVVHQRPKQHISVNSSMALPSAIRIRGVSLGSGTVVHSARRTFAQIVRRRTPTTELMLSSCSRLLSMSRRFGGFPTLRIYVDAEFSLPSDRPLADSGKLLHGNIYHPQHD